MTTPTEQRQQTLTAAHGFFIAIKNGQIDGTERRQLQDAGYNLKALAYEYAGQALVNFSHDGEAGNIPDLDALIDAAEGLLATSLNMPPRGSEVCIGTTYWITAGLHTEGAWTWVNVTNKATGETDRLPATMVATAWTGMPLLAARAAARAA